MLIKEEDGCEEGDTSDIAKELRHTPSAEHSRNLRAHTRVKRGFGNILANYFNCSILLSAYESRKNDAKARARLKRLILIKVL